MIKAFILSQLRHYAAMAGASLATYLIANGASPEDANVVGGAVLSLSMCLWSLYAHWKTHVKLQTKNAEIAVLKANADSGNMGNQ